MALSEIALQKANEHVKHFKKNRFLIEKAYAYHIPMRTLMVFTCQQVDDEKNEHVGLLTPVLKSYFTEKGCDHINMALNIVGESDNDPKNKIFQHFLDARISMICEGTNGIQALDLVLRKLPKNNFSAIESLLSDIEHCHIPNSFNSKKLHLEILNYFNHSYHMIKQHLEDDLECAATSAPYFLKSFALLLLSYMWIKHYERSKDKDLCLIFHKEAIREMSMYSALIEAGKESIMDFKIEYF